MRDLEKRLQALERGRLPTQDSEAAKLARLMDERVRYLLGDDYGNPLSPEQQIWMDSLRKAISE